MDGAGGEVAGLIGIIIRLPEVFGETRIRLFIFSEV